MAKKTIKHLSGDELLAYEKHNQEENARRRKEMEVANDLETEAEYIATLLEHQKIVKEWRRRAQADERRARKMFKK